ncbi:MAG: prenyltransferase/squalene oxidase repeat-containing protein [Candidatus Kariarchaeaceae archaeon]
MTSEEILALFEEWKNKREDPLFLETLIAKLRDFEEKGYSKIIYALKFTFGLETSGKHPELASSSFDQLLDNADSFPLYFGRRIANAAEKHYSATGEKAKEKIARNLFTYSLQKVPYIIQPPSGYLFDFPADEMITTLSQFITAEGAFSKQVGSDMPDIYSTFQGVILSLALDALNVSQSEKILNWLMSFYDPYSGLFANNVEMTAMSVIILKAIDKLPELNHPQTASILAENYSAELTTPQTYILVALSYLSSIDLINTRSSISKVFSERSSLGGFGSSSNSTYEAVSQLQTLKSLSKLTPIKRLTNFLIRTQSPSGGFHYIPGQPPSLQGTFEHVQVITALNLMHKFDASQIVSYCLNQWKKKEQLDISFLYYIVLTLKAI